VAKEIKVGPITLTSSRLQLLNFERDGARAAGCPGCLGFARLRKRGVVLGSLLWALGVVGVDCSIATMANETHQSAAISALLLRSQRTFK